MGLHFGRTSFGAAVGFSFRAFSSISNRPVFETSYLRRRSPRTRVDLLVNFLVSRLFEINLLALNPRYYPYEPNTTAPKLSNKSWKELTEPLLRVRDRSPKRPDNLRTM